MRLASARALREPSEANNAALAFADGLDESRSHVSDSYNLAQQAEVLLLAGDCTSAAKILQRAFAFVEEPQEGLWLPDLHILAGRIELAGPEPDPERALACFTEAMAVADRQGARMLRLRAATRKARLLCKLGRLADPAILIGPSMAELDGGEESRDVREANAFIAEAVT